MSCYEWEKGEWKLSCVEFRKLRDALIQGFNEIQEHNLQVAAKVKAEFDRIRKNKEEFKAAIKDDFIPKYSTRDPQAYRVLFGVICRRLQVSEYVMREALMVDKKEVPADPIGPHGYTSFRLITKKDGTQCRLVRSERKFPKTPKKKDFPKATKATNHYRVGGEANIYLDLEHRIVKWVVGENNHACETAREHKMANVFWRAIDRVEWTRGTGGRLWGSDEYRDDANRDSGYGGDMTKQSWGNEKEAREKRLRARFG